MVVLHARNFVERARPPAHFNPHTPTQTNPSPHVTPQAALPPKRPIAQYSSKPVLHALPQAPVEAQEGVTAPAPTVVAEPAVPEAKPGELMRMSGQQVRMERCTHQQKHSR